MNLNQMFLYTNFYTIQCIAGTRGISFINIIIDAMINIHNQRCQ